MDVGSCLIQVVSSNACCDSISLSPSEHMNSQAASRIAVIGGGISGLIAAKTLQDQGVRVTVFDKGRGVGGRMSTRRVDHRGINFSFDHGAQYFTARDPLFISAVETWVDQGVVANWPSLDRGVDQKIVVLEEGHVKSESVTTERFVALPSMNSICKHLACNLEIRTRVRVAKILSTKNGLKLIDESGNSLGVFERLIVSAPPVQASELLGNFPALSKRVSSIQMNPCWAAMIAFDSPLTNKWAGAFLQESFISWAARNNTKPGRNQDVESLVIHADPNWTAENWTSDPEDVAKKMLAEFWRVSGIRSREPFHLNAHRWKYAIPVEPSKARCIADQSAVIVACGDWASGSRVEGAYLSGVAAAGKVLQAIAST